MPDPEQLFLAILGLYLTPFFVILSLVVLPAFFGIKLGIRHFYLKALLWLFEFGRQRIEVACKNHGLKSSLPPPPIQQNGKYSPSLNSNANLIQKDSPRHLAEGLKEGTVKRLKEASFDDIQKRGFNLSDVCYVCKKGVEAIIDDDVTKRFSAEELSSWNLLTRTSMRYQYLSLRLTVLWVCGCLFRYIILFPIRVFTIFIAIAHCVTSSALVDYLPEGRVKKAVSRYCLLTTMRIAARGFSASLTFHNSENKAKGGGICAANHTTPIDVFFLSSDNIYSLIGQQHTAFTGFIQRCLSRSGANHIWFERSEMKDRKKVTARLESHVADDSNFPILIFPEGTCINNTSVMMFKKGSFEIGGTIYPVAMKYDPRFGDPFWNSSRYSMVRYLMMILTSWAMVCDVWYLPPMKIKEGETAVQFANRVKAEIARQGGLVDLIWDGQLKRSSVKSSYREKEQEEYSKLIKDDCSQLLKED